MLSLPRVFALSLLFIPLAFSQPTPLLIGAGDYNIVDRSQIEKARIDWSALVQKQDQEMYTKATDESYAAYQSLYNEFQKLRQIHIDTVLTKKGDAAVPAAELATVISEYLKQRDLFSQKLAAIEVVRDVWQGQEKASRLDNTRKEEYTLVYEKGSLNLAAFAETYRKALQELDAKANAFTYRYKDNRTIVETKPGLGLELPTSGETPQSLAAKNKEFKEKAALSDQELNVIGSLSIAISHQMLQFMQSHGTRLYWFNDVQEEDKKAWIESVQTKARLLKWIRSVYCMRLGVPGLDIPKPSKFNIDYLKRGLPESYFRIVQKAEMNEGDIRSTLTRFDQIFVSLQSQSGEFNSKGGFIGFVNSVNSTLTWQNEVDASMNILYILRENMIDELDLFQGPTGCSKIRERYYQKYGSLKDPDFAKIAQGYLEGMNLGGDGDYVQKAFYSAGDIILSKGLYMIQLRKFLNDHPSATLIGQTLGELGDDIR